MTTFKGQLVFALVLNVGLKVLTFTLSTLLTRKLLPYQNGVYFTFNVYNDAVLFAAREATRNVASRISILAESAEADEDSVAAGSSTTALSDRKVAARPLKAPPKVEVANVRRVVAIALCSVPLAIVAAAALEAIGACFGSISLFPSMMRHARVSQQQQPPPQLYGTPAFSGAMGAGGGLDRLPLLVLPYLPELTVVGCTVLMAFAEPCVVLVQSLNLFRVVVVAECAALSARLLTILAVIYASQRHGAHAVQADGEALNGNGLRSLWEARMALAFGQLAYAVVHVLYYAVVMSGLSAARWLGASAELQQVRIACLAEGALSTARPDIRQDCPPTAAAQQLPSGTFPDDSPKLYRLFAFPWCYYTVLDAMRECRREAALLGTFLRESVLRLILSEGESFALTSLGSEAARGYYQLIYSLGSLVARLLFRVWENACFVKWSREASLGHQKAAVQLLKLMLRLSFYAGFSFALLGPPITRTFLTTMYTSRWATPQVTEALQLCFYGMPLMAWNGLLEAFLRAVASPQVLQRLQRWMIGETVVYIAACYVALMSFGKDDEQGDSVSVLVLLNTLNMLWRCGASVYLLSSSPTAHPHATKPARKEEASRDPAAPVVEPPIEAAIPATTSMVRLHEFAHLFPLPLLLSFVVLFGVSRAVAASVATLAGVGVAYGALILACDPEVRRLLVAPVWTRVVCVVRSSGTNVTKSDATKKKQR